MCVTAGYDYWMTASYISEHTMWNSEIRSKGGEGGCNGGEQWRRDTFRGCLKRESQAVGRDLGHTGFFNHSHNMQCVCYLRCPAAAILLGNATAIKLRRDSLCRTCYYFPKATIWSFRVPNEQAQKSLSLHGIFLGFVANWTEGLNRLNLSPVIIGDYEHLDILLFSIVERSGH